MKNPMILIAVLTLVVGFALPLHAEQTITVNTFGEVKVKPDVLVLEGTISETNEKMKDAVTGFNDTKRRAMAAINEMGIENLTVKTSSLSLSIAGAPQGGPFGGIDAGEVAAPGAMQISQSVTLTVTGVDQMEQQAVIDLVVKLMEGVKEAGVDMSKMDAESMMMMQMGMGGGGGASAIYKVSDPEAAQKAATKAAVEKARADAAYLAELAGGKLGKVVAISDGIAPASGDDGPGGNAYLAMIWGMMSGEDGSDPYSTGTLDEVTVGRALSVSFELITE
ncbi:MAG: SIMPL domain-containing protein [Planctomycetota bacterium]